MRFERSDRNIFSIEESNLDEISQITWKKAGNGFRLRGCETQILSFSVHFKKNKDQNWKNSRWECSGLFANILRRITSKLIRSLFRKLSLYPFSPFYRKFVLNFSVVKPHEFESERSQNVRKTSETCLPSSFLEILLVSTFFIKKNWI